MPETGTFGGSVATADYARPFDGAGGGETSDVVYAVPSSVGSSDPYVDITVRATSSVAKLNFVCSLVNVVRFRFVSFSFVC